MRRFFLILTLQFILLAAVDANTLLVNEQGDVFAESDRYRVQFENGVLTYFHNKLTQETYTQGEFIAHTGIKVRDGGLGTHVRQRDIKILSPLSCELIYLENDMGLHLFISIDAETGDLLIQQKALSQTGGIERIAWGISHLSHTSVELIAPVWGGQVITQSDRYNYPGRWEAQLAILQSQDGGFFVRSDDATYRFKVMEYRPKGDSFKLTFWETPHAPFQEKEITTAIWRLNAYRGDWQVPALAYRQWMHEALEPADRTEMPAWVNDIQLVVIHADPLEKVGNSVIDILAKHTDPKKTLLYVTGWRKAGWRWNYPDYTPTDNFGEFMTVAHGYGFKVMPHVNMVAVSPAHPLYTEFAQYQMTDPYNGEKFIAPANSTEPLLRQYALINPASSAFRKMLVDRLKNVWETYRVDAFHIDVNMTAVNDGNGLIEGLTVAEGNILLHQEFRDAMPGIVLSGEGLNEVNFLHTSFTQYHLIRPTEQPHLINAFLFSPYVRFYGHLGFPNPDRYPDQYQNFYPAYAFWGVLPTVRLDGVADLDPNFTETYNILSRSGRKPADVNSDGIVNILDLTLVAQHLGTRNPEADVNSDGIVNILDLTLVAAEIG
ncbi:MAG: DUF6259 domain-containing protein [Candidatus Poribacteria bacterium]|nr:DUF6259 domain-containing protein [Candidatus Poribacteria bacterium]